jgi:hypothetical protein
MIDGWMKLGKPFLKCEDVGGSFLPITGMHTHWTECYIAENVSSHSRSMRKRLAMGMGRTATKLQAADNCPLHQFRYRVPLTLAGVRRREF